jgi:hypothetical protein
MVRAAFCTSRNVDSAVVALAGLMSTAINDLGHQVMQEPQPLGYHLAAEIIDAGRVASGPGEAGDKTKLDAVAALAANAACVRPGVPITATYRRARSGINTDRRS